MLSNPPAGKVRPLWKVILFSIVTLLAYYGYYKWVIQDELKRYTGSDWSGAMCMVPFLLGVAVPQALWLLVPALPDWVGGLLLLGLGWVYLVQFRLYRTVNRLYREAGLKPPLTIWWMLIPGMNIWVGLRQIHFLSQYWAMKQETPSVDPVSKALPLFFASLLAALIGWSASAPVLALPLDQTGLTTAPVLAMGSLFQFSGDRPANLGLEAGQLAPCPDSPNCVSSQSADPSHRIAPISFEGTPEQAIAHLKAIIQAQPRTQIVTETENYLHAEFTSFLMGFVDDVEFYLQPDQPEIQVRSASRLGESDLGVNRKRIETLRSQFDRRDFPTPSASSS
jgi:uncharacterized protein (DUF1499 family)